MPVATSSSKSCEHSQVLAANAVREGGLACQKSEESCHTFHDVDIEYFESALGALGACLEVFGVIFSVPSNEHIHTNNWNTHLRCPSETEKKIHTRCIL